MPKLGVNIDHVATLRQARGEEDPDPIQAAKICEQAGAHSIVCHLREDQRHIQLRDVKALRKTVKTRLNLEMSINKRIVDIALRIKPDEVTLVPERRQELTTEGGLDVIRFFTRIKKTVTRFQKNGITVSLFVDPLAQQIRRSQATGATMIELHTGKYALVTTAAARRRELRKLKDMTRYARSLGLTVNAGHGLKYHNTRAIARIPGIEELNIGHSIISRAVFTGLGPAVKEMIRLAA